MVWDLVMKLPDKLAVVTGGGRGIGREIALALAREGADVVVAARTFEEITRTAVEVGMLGRRSLAVRTDVRSGRDVKNLISKTKAAFGRIDIFINNAGVALRKNLVETSDEELDSIIDTNLKGTFLCCREVVPMMAKGGGGVIVNISSGAGKTGIPELSAYCASKFAILGLTEALAYEVAESGIRVYAVCPGGVDTGMYRSMFPEDTSALLRPEYVAGRVLELCLPECRLRSGSSVEVYK